jgi:hypothetical protein
MVEIWWRPAHGEHADQQERPYYWSGPSDPGRATEWARAAVFSSQSAAEEAWTLAEPGPLAGSRLVIITAEEAESRNDPYPREFGWVLARLRRVAPAEAQT